MSNLGNTLLPKRVTKSFTEINQTVRSKIDECVAKLNQHYNITLPPIKFNLFGIKKGVVAGKADIKNNTILINLQLMLENWDEFVSSTLVHETAHICQYYLHWKTKGRALKPHGPEFVQVMNVLGLPGARCHTYNTTNVKATIDYICNCPNKIYKLGKTVSNRIAMGQKRSCLICNSPVRRKSFN